MKMLTRASIKALKHHHDALAAADELLEAKAERMAAFDSRLSRSRHVACQARSTNPYENPGKAHPASH
jgi:hypothetical protein